MKSVQTFLEFFKNKMNLLSILVALLGAYIVFPNYFEANIYPLESSANSLWMSLDPSWLLALNYFKLKGLSWGNEIAFTYGPLSYLSTRVGWGIHRIDFILYDLFLSLNFFLLFFISFKQSQNKILTFLVLASVVLLFPVWLGSANALILMAFLIFWIRQSIDTPKPIYYLFQIIILVLVFFIKFNTGLIAFPLFLAGIFYNMIVRNTKIYFLVIYAVLPVVLILILSQFLQVALLSYIKSGFEIVSGYNDVMYLDHIKRNRNLAITILLATLIILVYKIYVERKEQLLKNVVVSFLFGTSIFVLYKQGFVRGMEVDFFLFSPLLIFAVYDLHDSVFKKLSSVLILLSLGISFYFVLEVEKESLGINKKFDKHYIEAAKNFTSTSGLHLFPNNNQLPFSVKQKIGTSTVDVYPWNIQMLIENKLNYLPRPVFQSYFAYTSDLQEMNFQHYNSSKAPEFVVFDFASVDYRYSLFDEPKVNLALYKNYKVAEVFDFENRKVLLLQKKKDFKAIRFEKIKEYAMYVNAPLVPKEGIYYKVEMYNSLKGRIKTIFDHAPEIQLEIKTNKNYPYPFRTSKKLLESGFFSEKYIVSTMGFNDFMNNQISNEVESIKYYNFKPKDLSLFKEKIKITEYKIVQ